MIFIQKHQQYSSCKVTLEKYCFKKAITTTIVNITKKCYNWTSLIASSRAETTALVFSIHSTGMKWSGSYPQQTVQRRLHRAWHVWRERTNIMACTHHLFVRKVREGCLPKEERERLPSPIPLFHYITLLYPNTLNYCIE